MLNDALSLMAHLMRRAGFGATREELSSASPRDTRRPSRTSYTPRRTNGGYLPVPALLPLPMEARHTRRHRPVRLGVAHDKHRRSSPRRRYASWHQIFATGVSKVDHYDEITDMIAIFREKGLGKYRDLLLEVSRNPAMLYWLDNHENHATAINENWGRELLETVHHGCRQLHRRRRLRVLPRIHRLDHDSQAPRFHMGRWDWYFEYKPDDQDEARRTSWVTPVTSTVRTS